jgi:hypothetical protein
MENYLQSIIFCVRGRLKPRDVLVSL